MGRGWYFTKLWETAPSEVIIVSVFVGTPALPSHLNFFEVARERRAKSKETTSTDSESSTSTEKRNKFAENNFHIPGVEPLSTGTSDFPNLSRSRVEATKKVISMFKLSLGDIDLF